jgi:signal transduction histidine kinase
VERLRRLTDDLLDLSADRPLRCAPVSLESVVAGAAEALAARFPQVTVTSAMVGLPELSADAQRLHQVFTNLFVNAAEAGAHALEVKGAVEPRGVQVSVRDDGPGIPPELRARLFEPFVTAGKASGTGIGLALARRIVERHGGRLELVPSSGPGATFSLWFPVEPAR